jgi:hypothetical protein
MCRIAVAEALYGDHYVAPGDTGVFAIISAERPQAVERLSTIKAILAVLGVECKALQERVELTNGRAIRCYTASLAGVVSMTCIGAMLDEMTRWQDNDSGSNPAKEIISSLLPTMATCPNAKVWMISSPYSTLDEHCRRFDLGDGDGRLVFHGATWEANPTLTEQRTRDLEPDEQAWAREYAAIPMASDESKFFSAALIDAARKNVIAAQHATTIASGADFAFSKDSSGLVCASLIDGCVRVDSDKQWKVTGEPLRPTAVISEAISLAEAYGSEGIACDTHYIELVREETEATGLELVSFPNTSEGIAQAYTDVRVMLGRGQIDLSRASGTLIDELKETMGKPTTHGITITHPRKNGSHGDLARAFITAVWCLKNGISGDAVIGGNRRCVGMGPSRGGESGRREWSDTPDYD